MTGSPYFDLVQKLLYRNASTISFILDSITDGGIYFVLKEPSNLPNAYTRAAFVKKYDEKKSYFVLYKSEEIERVWNHDEFYNKFYMYSNKNTRVNELQVRDNQDDSIFMIIDCKSRSGSMVQSAIENLLNFNG